MILKGVGKMSESKTSVAPANSSGSKKQTAKMLGFGGFFAMTASMVMTGSMRIQILHLLVSI